MILTQDIGTLQLNNEVKTMFRSIINEERRSLGFLEQVSSAFDFLTKEYGFRCVESETTFVRYESHSVFVNVYHGRSSYELGVEIGELFNRPKTEQQRFTIGEIMEVKSMRNKEGFTFFQASTKERVMKYVPKLAEYVKHYAVDALLGDHNIFTQLEELRERKSQQYLKEIEVKRIREKAGIAWREKNFEEFTKLYDTVQDKLTPAEKAKLRYARKK